MMKSAKTAEPESFPGGPGVVQALLRTRLNRLLTLEQAEALWAECRAWLLAHGLGETVGEAESTMRGRLDTLPRGDVLSALAFVVTGLDWPLNMTPESEAANFRQKLKSGLLERGYAVADEPCA